MITSIPFKFKESSFCRAASVAGKWSDAASGPRIV